MTNSSSCLVLSSSARTSARQFGLIALLTVMSGRNGVAQDQSRELLSRIPPTANAVVILNVEKATNSPLGLRQGWKEKLDKSFAAGLQKVPSKATRFVLAADIDFEFMTPIWQVAVVDLSTPPSMEKIAQAYSGEMDKIENLPAVILPNDTTIVQFGPRTLGAMSPANRQAVARWLREIKVPTGPGISPYLQKAAGYSDDAGTEIIMALNLYCTFSQERVVKYLKSKPWLDEQKADRVALTKLIRDVDGLRAGIRIGEKPSGRITLDFRGDVAPLAPFAKKLLLEVLADGGMMIDDLEYWKFETKGTTVSLSGDLSPSGLRKLLSVVDSTAPGGKASEQETASSSQKPSPTELEARRGPITLDYFKTVTAYFDDLKKDMKDSKTLAQNSLWFDKYARKIERLPMLNVDSEMLDYGAFVAHQMRQGALAVRTMGIESGARQSQINSADVAPYAYGGYGYGRYGGGYAVYDSRAEAKAIQTERRVVRAEEKGEAATSIQSIKGEVIEATAQVRRKMTEKYQIEF